MVNVVIAIIQNTWVKGCQKIRKHWAILFLLALGAESKLSIYVENNI
jgi:hypothetical protein